MSTISKTMDGQAGLPTLDPHADVTSSLGLPTGPVQPLPYLKHLRRVIRRPFELLTLKSRVSGGAAPLSEAFIQNIEVISTAETSDFAFSVAELAYRLDQMRDEITDADAQEGLEVLSHMARMYEHIFILQTEG